MEEIAHFETLVPIYRFTLRQIPETVNAGSSSDASVVYLGEL
jgi:hypothetical protein